MAPPFENYPHSGGCRCFCKRSFSSVTPNKLSKVAFTCLQIVVGHRSSTRKTHSFSCSLGEALYRAERCAEIMSWCPFTSLQRQLYPCQDDLSYLFAKSQTCMARLAASMSRKKRKAQAQRASWTPDFHTHSRSPCVLENHGQDHKKLLPLALLSFVLYPFHGNVTASSQLCLCDMCLGQCDLWAR